MMTVKEINYSVYGRCVCATYEGIELIATLEVGPRIVSLKNKTSDNIFFNDVNDVCVGKEYADKTISAYGEEKGIWQVEIEDEYVDIKEEVYGAIEACNRQIGDTVCKRAVVMIDKDLFEEHPDVKYENIEFLPVKNQIDIEALKTIID